MAKCWKNVPALVSESGSTRRPERICDTPMLKLDKNLWSCPRHGLVNGPKPAKVKKGSRR